MDGNVIEKFWKHVDRSKKADVCWRWTGAMDKGGYGKLLVSGKNYTAHRLSWEIENGQEIPNGFVVMHKCDNPICVNPAHLSIGTTSDNIRDCVKKGRNHKWSSPGFTGEAFHKSTLTEERVIKIRESYNRKSGMTYEKLGEIYGVSMVTICHIVKRRTWKYL
jgi:hypothetical protein